MPNLAGGPKIDKDDIDQLFISSFEESKKRTHFYDVEKNSGVTQESKELLDELFNTTSVYSMLQPEQKQLFLSIYEQGQIDSLQDIDKDLGYVNHDSHVHCMYQALNLLTPDERGELLKTIGEGKEQPDNDGMVATYMMELF